MTYISYGRHYVSEADINATIKVLRSDYLTQGPVVSSFEQKVAAYCGVQYGVAVNSATSALHIACLALDLGQGDGSGPLQIPLLPVQIALFIAEQK